STNDDDNHNSGTGVRRTERAIRECTYTDFLKCQPLPFKGTEGVSSLSQWCERMETLTSRPLVMKPLTVKGTDLASYTQRYQVLALLCGKMFSKESDKIEKYVGGLPDMIHRSVVASKPKTMQEAIEIATELMDKKIRTFAERETASKRNMDWLAKYQVVIVCAEKIVRIPWGNETLIIHGDGSNQGNATRLSIISCTKTEKYVKKGFPIFLAHITTKEVEDKSEKK
nr:reverse transcriptase domain-containing protein [Tanacetum cinerariifolium]